MFSFFLAKFGRRPLTLVDAADRVLFLRAVGSEWGDLVMVEHEGDM